MKNQATLTSLLTLALAFAASSALARDKTELDPKAAAVAHLKPAKNQNVTGTVQFIPVAGGVRVLAHVTNLTPGEHGFHVHEHGDLSAPDLTSAGGHFNPTKHPHAGPDADHRHTGDLGNLTAGADGTATVDRVDTKISLEGPNSILNRSVIVHAAADDLHTQPTGNSGARVAGGLVEPVKK